MSIQWQIAILVVLVILNFRLTLKQHGINQAILSTIIWIGFTLAITLTDKYSGLGLTIMIIAGIISLILWLRRNKKKKPNSRL